MAEIKFTAFIEDWTKSNPQHPDWAMKTAEPHRKKDGDEWVTVGRTFRTVKGGYLDNEKVNINFSEFAKGERVDIVGTEVTETREHDGKKYYDLVVKASSVKRHEGQGGQSQQPRRTPAISGNDEPWAATPVTSSQGFDFEPPLPF